MKIALTALLFLSSTAQAADVTFCSSTKRNDGRWWSWREIDGKRCWFPGRSKAKSELRWSVGRGPPLLQSQQPTQPPPQVQSFVPVTPTKPEEEDLAAVCCWPDLTQLEMEARIIEDKKLTHQLVNQVPESVIVPPSRLDWLLLLLPLAALFYYAPTLERKIRKSFPFSFRRAIVGKPMISSNPRRQSVPPIPSNPIPRSVPQGISNPCSSSVPPIPSNPEPRSVPEFLLRRTRPPSDSIPRISEILRRIP